MIKCCQTVCVLFFLLTGISLATVEKWDYAHYEIIVNRKPFGEPAPEAPAGPHPASEPSSFFKDFKLVALCPGPDSAMNVLRVGFVNSTKSYYLAVGEQEDDILVLSADAADETATLRHGTEEQILTLNATADSAVPPGGGPAASTTTADSAGKPPFPAERTRRRTRDTISRREVEPPKMTDQELEKHLKDYQMDLIRKGDPPLPIPLTPEMDEQLVKEGVLPPAVPSTPEAVAK